MAMYPEQSVAGRDGPRRALILSVGCFALVAQALLFREFLAVFEGNELGIAWFFATWLLWVAAGALAARLPASGLDWLADRFDALPLLYVPAYVLQSWLIGNAREFSGVEAYELFPMASMLLASFLANAPISFLSGLLFALACRWMARSGRVPAATVYVCEAVGSCLGGVTVTLLLWRGVSAQTIFFAASLPIAAAFCACRLARRAWVSAWLPLLALVAACVSGLDETWRRAGDLNAWRRLLPPETYRGSFVTPQARYLHGEDRGRVNVLAWESIVDAIPNTEYASSVVALHLAQHPAARRFMVIGPGAFALCRRFLVLPRTESVTWLDPDPRYPEHLLRILPRELGSDDPRLVMPGADIRVFLAQTRNTYDLVVLNLPDATTLSRNRYFTREFFQLLKSRLARSGVVGLRVSGGENFMGAELVNLGASAFHTLGAVFRHVVVKPGDESWFLACDEDRLSTSPALLRDRFRQIDGSDAVYPAEGLLSLYPPDRTAFQERRYRAAAGTAPPGALLNSDRKPRALFHSLQLAAREAGADRSLMAALRAFAVCGAPLIPFAVLLYAVLRLAFLLNGRRAARGGQGVPAAGSSLFDSHALVFSAGAAGMAFSIALMFAYQSVFGSIFLYAGLISALFMLGLFVGGAAIVRYTAGKGGAGRGAVLMVLCLHAALTATVAVLPRDLPRGVFALLFFLGGLCSGVYLPLAASRLKQAGVGDRQAGALLDLDDHLGGACGGLVTGLVLLPVFGPAYALGIAAVVLAANLLPLFAGRARAQAGAAAGRYEALVRPAAYAAFGVALFLLVSSLRFHAATQAPLRERFDEAARAMAGDAVPVERQAPLGSGQDLRYYVVTDPAGDVASYLFSTEQLAPHIRGYGGPLTLAVMLDKEGGLRDFKIVRSNETPAYLDLLRAWMQGLQGRRLFGEDAPADVDAVTGATLTCVAIADTLDAAGAAFAGDALGLGSARPVPRDARPRFDARLLCVALLAAAALALRRRPRRGLRRLLLVATALLCGVLLNTQYSLAQMLSLAGLQAPPPGLTVTTALVLGLPLLVLLFGNFYCGYLCPFGAMQELVGYLRPRRLQTDPDRAVWRCGRLVKYALLFLVIVVFARRLDAGLSSCDLLVSVFSARRSVYTAGLAAVALCCAFFYGRFWCRCLCPAGAFLALLNGARLLRRFVPGVNHKLCPFGVATDRDLDCICCDRCRVTTAREREALVAARDRPHTSVRPAFLAAVMILAAVFAWRLFSVGSAAARVAAGMPAAGAQARDVDMPTLRRLIEQRRLSDHEAKYYRLVPAVPDPD